MGKSKSYESVTTKASGQPTLSNEEQCLIKMNEYLKELKIEGQWSKYDEIKLIGQPSRVLFYSVIGVLFPLVYVFSQSYRVIPQQNIVLQLLCIGFALYFQSALPRRSYTIQIPNLPSVCISCDEVATKDSFPIASKMYEYMREMERTIRVQRLDDIKNKKKS